MSAEIDAEIGVYTGARDVAYAVSGGCGDASIELAQPTTLIEMAQVMRGAKGEPGTNGTNGINGTNGVNGLDAPKEIYVNYKTQEIDVSGSTTYIRKASAIATEPWLIARVVDVGEDTIISYASTRNNPAVAAYAAAWTARASLVYGEINEA